MLMEMKTLQKGEEQNSNKGWETKIYKKKFLNKSKSGVGGGEVAVAWGGRGRRKL